MGYELYTLGIWDINKKKLTFSHPNSRLAPQSVFTGTSLSDRVTIRLIIKLTRFARIVLHY